MTYTMVEKPERVAAVDMNGIEICGARRPYGHREWVVYTTIRLTKNNHQVIATTRETAIEHVKLLAELFCHTVPVEAVA